MAGGGGLPRLHKNSDFFDGRQMLVLVECNPVILILVLTLVLVRRPSAGARGSKKLVLLAFRLSICHLQNYEESHGEMMM